MGRPRNGRPPKGAGDLATRQLRVFADLGEKVADLVEVLDTATANLVDPILRPEIEALYEMHRHAIERYKAAKAVLQQTAEEVRREAAQKKPPRRRGG